MLKLRALNRESSSDEDAPTIRREAQEEIALDLYNKALRLQCNNELNEAEEIIKKLINESIPQLENEGGLPKTMSTLKYSCFINLGSISTKKGETKSALDNYLQASELDKKDVTLWFKIGKLALKLDRFRQAAYAFYMGLECSESHWPCLDQLISVLYVLRDTIACLKYIGKALILDQDYMKGLVLRKQIYACNSATREYYQLFNPDYVLEPSLDVQIDEEEEKQVLDEVELLSERIREVEKALAPKPLATIPLPKPLSEFSWLALGHTLIELHKYITNNNMNHFTMIDLKKCMSINEETEVMDVEEPSILESEEISNKAETVIAEEKIKEVVIDSGQELEKMDLEEVVERRLSQNSENDANDTENRTPVQTDNDEMEQDVEDQGDPEESIEQKVDKSKSHVNRGIKRRRDLVSDLQIWGWHSKRKSSKKNKVEKDFTIQDALTRIIPNQLLPNGLKEDRYNSCEDSMSTMEIYQLHMEEKTLLSPIHSPISDENGNNTQYFGTEKEREDIRIFWTKKRSCCDAVNLIEEYTHSLSNMWFYKWPKGLVDIYIEAYNMFREHCDHPHVFSQSVSFEEHKKDALATLLYGELLTYNPTRNRSNEHNIHCTSVSQLQLISAWDANWEEEHAIFFVRVNWLRAHLFRKNLQNSLSICALQLIAETIQTEEKQTETPFSLLLPNCNKYGIITLPILEKLLKNLEMIDSLSRLEELFDNQRYAEVAEIIKNTFNSNHHPTYGKIGRPAQIGMLLHALWFTDISDCFVWTEECLYEALDYLLKPKKNDDKWEAIAEKCLLILQEIIKMETVSVVDCLSEEKRSRLVDTLCRICCKQLGTENAIKLPLSSITPWILLHYILLREEHRQQARKKIRKVKKDDENQEKLEEITEENTIPPSIAILFSGHEFLGPKGCCLTNQGELPHFIIDCILDRLDTPIFENLRDKIDIHLEQAFFCLYQHPSKKNKISRHLADHNVNPLPLSWERAQQIYEYFCPVALPEFDSYKSISISSELEQLLQRIIALVPNDCDPQPLLSDVTEYVNGNSNTLPDPISFPAKTRSIYYLLGDYYFKQSEVKRSLKYFLLDLCISPLRLDTWACMALGIASQLEYKLTYCERFKSEMEFLEKAKSAQVCFKEALKISNDHITLWIEFGSFEYMVHSFCSRVLKYESDTLSMEKFETLENKKEAYLSSSRISFLRALELYQPDQSEADERWLHHYMLAKIDEKHQKEPSDYLQHYLLAAKFLQENNATYPEKINYSNPQHLSLEALEVFYRLNASILKYLELHEGKPIPSSVGKTFKKCLDSTSFAKEECKQQPQKEIAKPKEDDKINELHLDVQKCIQDLITQVEMNEKETQQTTDVPTASTVKDVIMISDSDEEKNEQLNKTNSSEPKIKVRNVQDIMDALMKETMNNTDMTDMDSSATLTEVNLDTSVEMVTKSDKTAIEIKKSEKTESDKVSREESSSSSSSSSDSSSSETDSDDSSSSSTSTSSDNSTGNLSEGEVLVLVDLCILGLEQCIRRLPQNYKALYRLAHLYYHYGKRKDLNKAKQLLLGEYKCKDSFVVNGLFADRKISNFFNGIWRIPSSEIDRPGSLSAHMGRCVTLLLQVLRNTNDHKTLLDLCLQLRRIPDADKVYIRHSEREQLSEQALSMCIQSLRSLIKNTAGTAATEKLMNDIFKAYQRSQKNLAHKEGVFSSMLIEVYKKNMGDKLPDNVNVLDLAVKFCQQNRAAEKLKKQQTLAALPRIPTLPTASPVLPPPSNVSPNQPLKRPGLGRPRGRPPGPKLSTQMRSPRGRSPAASNPFMFDAAAMDYMRQYQEELIRQYSKTLNFQQMAQLAQLSASTLKQSPNLLNSQLVQAAQQLGVLNPQLLASSLNLLNPNLFKKTSDQMNINTSLPSSQISNEHLFNSKYLSSLGPSTSKASSINNSTLKQKANTSSTVSTKANLMQPLYQVSGMSQTKVSSSTIPSQTKTSTTFKYPTVDVAMPIIRDLTKTSPNYQKSSMQKVQKEREKATNVLMKERPNISITPVTQPSQALSPSKSISPGKTLQEKLADKQKQNLKGVARSIDFMKPSITNTTVAHKANTNPVIPPSLNVIPNFSKDSGISISQIPVVQKPIDSLSIFRSDSSSLKPKSKSANVHSNVSLSVIRKPEEKQKETEDVIIIE